MKDAAAKIADKMFQVDWDGRPLHDRAASAQIIRSAIRRAVTAERERCVGIVKKSRHTTIVHEYICDKIIDAIQAKRPSKRKGRR